MTKSDSAGMPERRSVPAPVPMSKLDPAEATEREMQDMLDRFALELVARGRKAMVLISLYDRFEGDVVTRLRQFAVLDAARERVRRLRDRRAKRF
ncbi:hypothetical protein GFL72_01880 [Rhizobium leguminosarum bv. viciae]|uniref:hypothetical protein n=1 Tax=Rhizobium leguminosarum TaxID=384 RepID=UPI00131A42C5|nr:hypothetical protein [Rhizobium leguminosarum]NKK33413.1 hypothetical protein [Rhizobium leguminosarum bv. viciae]